MSKDSPRNSTRVFAAALLSVAGLVAAGCASSETTQETDASSAQTDLTPVTLTLNYLAGGPNAGFMVAAEKGYYRDAGLDVTIQEGQGSNSTAALVAAGNSQFGYVDAPSAMAVASKDGDLSIIGPILQTNGFSVMSLADANITDVSALAGKTVALQPGTAQASLFDAVLAANEVPQSEVTITNIDPSALVGSLIQGNVDAITAGADSQGVQLRRQGADINELMYRDIGVGTVGLSIVTQGAYAEQNPDVVRKFVEASLKGWDDARNDVDGAASIVSERFPAGADKDSVAAQLEVDKTLLCSEGAPGLGEVTKAHWDKTYELLVKYLDLPATHPIEHYFTNEYLPEALPSC